MLFELPSAALELQNRGANVAALVIAPRAAEVDRTERIPGTMSSAARSGSARHDPARNTGARAAGSTPC